MKVGQEIIINKKLERETVSLEDCLALAKMVWHEKSISPEKVIYLGKRTLSNGKLIRYDGGVPFYSAIEYIKALLVCPLDGKRNPFYIPDQCEVQE